MSKYSRSQSVLKMSIEKCMALLEESCQHLATIPVTNSVCSMHQQNLIWKLTQKCVGQDTLYSAHTDHHFSGNLEVEYRAAW